MILVALHGFLGSPQDWDSVIEAIPSEKEIDVMTPDLAVWATRGTVTDFESFAMALNKAVRKQVEETGETVMIAGYSLGARLAAHALLDDPELYQAAILISMNPGLPQNDLAIRRERLEADHKWAERFRRDAWETSWNAWNEQSVLKPGSRPSLSVADRQRLQDEAGRRHEGRREAWARAMEIWSLGDQMDLREVLLEWADGGSSGVEKPLTLMTGTDDVKFSELTSKWIAAAVPPENVRHRLVLGAGHRLLNEAPEDVASEISSLVSKS